MPRPQVKDAALLTSQSRQEILRRIERIPIVETLQMRIDELQDGLCSVTVPREIKYDGIYESLHGGILMTIADSIACFAIMTRTGHDQPMTTTDMNIRFLAPCLTDVTAVAKVIKFGKRLCPVAIDLFNAESKQVAVAQVNYMLLGNKPRR
jgi:uncharacterized protein (TIGR00369 family)